MGVKQSHYIPKFILDGFTDTDGMLHCYRVKERRWYRAKPAETGTRSHFYRIVHKQANDPEVVEKAYGEVESKVAPVIKGIVHTSQLPEEASSDMDLLVKFIADSALRVPRAKLINEWIADEVFQAEIVKLFSDPETWQKFRARQKEMGEDIPDSAQNDYVKLAESRAVELNKYEGWVWPYLADIAPKAAMKELQNFTWRLFHCSGSGTAVTSDVPVGLIKMAAIQQSTIRAGTVEPFVIGHWRSAIQVSMAISRSHILVGNRRDTPVQDQIGAEEELAELNAAHCWYCETIFSPGELPKFLLSDGQITGIAHFASKLEQGRANNKSSIRVPR